MRKLVWVRADWNGPWSLKKPFVTAAIESGADVAVVSPADAKAMNLGAISLASTGAAPWVGTVILSVPNAAGAEKALRDAKKLRAQRKKVAAYVDVKDKVTEKLAVKVGKAVDVLIVTAKDWKIIPLENIIAGLHGSNVSILAAVKNAEEAVTAAQTLEVGAAGVLLDARKAGPGEVKKTCEALEKLAAEKLELVPAEVKTVKTVGMGDRACIDTTSIMQIGEGMLVGSQAEGLFLVHSESLKTEFVESRPFRVNAGAVHAYIKVPGGKTRYMSELQAGDEVMIVDWKGEAKSGVIGRVKIERRPLVLVEATWKGKVYKTLLQNAETINLVGKDGNPISVAKLKPGDKILVYVEAGGRHFGMKVEETMIEK
ncbi:MAG: 3-dehydroquinate synthase II [Candidatus Hadarchaeota archaeon]